jgi:hypothetical protein
MDYTPHLARIVAVNQVSAMHTCPIEDPYFECIVPIDVFDGNITCPVARVHDLGDFTQLVTTYTRFIVHLHI